MITAVMPKAIRIHARGQRVEVKGPARRTLDVATQAKDVAQLLTRVGDVVRPLSIELEFGRLDPQLGAVVPTGATWLLEADGIEEAVCQAPALVHHAPPERMKLTPATVAKALLHRGELLYRLRFGVTMAWVHDAPLEGLAVEGVASRRAPVRTTARGRYVVGPLDVPGMRTRPPLVVTMTQRPDALVLAIEALWSPWREEGSLEHTALARLQEVA